MLPLETALAPVLPVMLHAEVAKFFAFVAVVTVTTKVGVSLRLVFGNSPDFAFS